MRIVFLTLSLVVVGCSSESNSSQSERTGNTSSEAASVDVQADLSKQAARNGKGSLFGDDLEFEKIRISMIDGTLIGETDDQAEVKAIVQSILDAKFTAEIDMAFPPNHFDTCVVVDLVHRKPKLSIKFHYDQGFVDPQHAPSMGMRWLSTNNDLGDFVKKHVTAHNGG